MFATSTPSTTVVPDHAISTTYCTWYSGTASTSQFPRKQKLFGRCGFLLLVQQHNNHKTMPAARTALATIYPDVPPPARTAVPACARAHRPFAKSTPDNPSSPALSAFGGRTLASPSAESLPPASPPQSIANNIRQREEGRKHDTTYDRPRCRELIASTELLWGGATCSLSPSPVGLRNFGCDAIFTNPAPTKAVFVVSLIVNSPTNSPTHPPLHPPTTQPNHPPMCCRTLT